MYFTILGYVFAGLLTLHIIRIQALDTKNPGKKFMTIMKAYWDKDRFFIMISVIALIVFSNLLNLGMAEAIIKGITGGGDVIDTKTPWGIRGSAYLVGLSCQFVIAWFSKRRKNAPEQVLKLTPDDAPGVPPI